MDEKFASKFKKGEETVSIEYLTGFPQGDHLVHLLFILVSQAAMESLEKQKKRNKYKFQNVPKYRQRETSRKIEWTKHAIEGHRVLILDISVR